MGWGVTVQCLDPSRCNTTFPGSLNVSEVHLLGRGSQRLMCMEEAIRLSEGRWRQSSRLYESLGNHIVEFLSAQQRRWFQPPSLASPTLREYRPRNRNTRRSWSPSRTTPTGNLCCRLAGTTPPTGPPTRPPTAFESARESNRLVQQTGHLGVSLLLSAAPDLVQEEGGGHVPNS